MVIEVSPACGCLTTLRRPGFWTSRRNPAPACSISPAIGQDGASAYRPLSYGPERDAPVRGPSAGGRAPAAPEAGAPETEVALSEGFTREAAKHKGEAKQIFDSILKGSLSPEQFDSIYGQVTENLGTLDALRFWKVNPYNRPVTLSPGQLSIVQSQIGRLQPDELRQAVQAQFDIAKQNGTVVCPKC